MTHTSTTARTERNLLTATRTLGGLALALLVALGSPPALQARGPVRGDATQALLQLFLTDRPLRVDDVDLREQAAPTDGRLFGDLPEDLVLHPSYQATYEICQEFNPYNRSSNEVSRERALEYLATVVDTAPVLEAFFVTGHDQIEDLADAWFGNGRGFEHTICGEGSRGKLGGYHFWYMHYRYEREGRATYLGADYGNQQQAGLADPRIITGQMTWDPDGPGGNRPLAKKPRGGFTVGNSVAVMLAAGHIAFYGANQNLGIDETVVEDADDIRIQSVFPANINGKSYDWTFHRDGSGNSGSIRTLWPRFVPGLLLAP